jgi:transcriptional regulator with XRE-family HTH domain
LVNRTGIGQAKISGIEGGKQNLTLKVLWRLASALQVHWADLLDDRTIDVPSVSAISTPFEQQLATFGTRMYQARVLQRLSQQGLAGRTGIVRSAVSEIEDGTQNVTLETLFRLANGLGVHWAELLDDRQTNPPQPAGPGEQPE